MHFHLRFFWRLGALGAVGLLVLGLSDCACETPITPGPQACRELRKAYDEKNQAWDKIQASIVDGTYGCLQAAYGKDGTLSQARSTLVRYKSDKNIYGQCPGGQRLWDCAPSIPLPNEASGQAVRLRLFFFAPDLDNAGDAGQRCDALAAADAKCLPGDECVLMMEFKAKLDGYQSYPIDGDPNKGCRFSFVGQDVEPIPEVTREAAPEPDASFEPLPEPQPEPQPEPRPEPTPEPDAPPELLPEPQPEPQPEPLPEGACSGQATRKCFDGPLGVRGVGACVEGTQTCQGGAWGPCVGSGKPRAEVCDKQDNDCDGQVDEGCWWHRAAGGNGQNGVFAGARAKDGKLFVTGFAIGAGTAKFGSLNRSLRSSYQTFVARLHPNGVWNSATIATLGAGAAYDEGLAAAAVSNQTSTVGFAVGGLFGRTLHIPFEANKTPMSPVGVLGSNGLYPNDGYLAMVKNDSALNWRWAMRFGDAGEDMISSVACCRPQPNGELALYAVGLHREGPGKSRAITAGRAMPKSYPFPPRVPQGVNSSVFLVEAIVNGATGALKRFNVKHLAVWAAHASTFGGFLSRSNGLPQVALVPGSQANASILYVSFHAKMAKTSVVYLGGGQTTSSGAEGLRSFVLRLDVTPTAQANDIRQTWHLLMPARDRADATMVRGLAARVEPQDTTQVAIVLAGSFVGKASFDKQYTSKGSADIFVARVRDQRTLSTPAKAPRWMWSLQAGGGGPDQANGVAFQGSSRIYVTGHSHGALQLPLSSTPSRGLARSTGPQLFLGRIEEGSTQTSATWRWVLGAGGQTRDSGHALVTTPTDLFVLGAYKLGKFFQSPVVGHSSSRAIASFVARNPQVPLALP